MFWDAYTWWSVSGIWFQTLNGRAINSDRGQSIYEDIMAESVGNYLKVLAGNLLGFYSYQDVWLYP